MLLCQTWLKRYSQQHIIIIIIIMLLLNNDNSLNNNNNNYADVDVDADNDDGGKLANIAKQLRVEEDEILICTVYWYL